MSQLVTRYLVIMFAFLFSLLCGCSPSISEDGSDSPVQVGAAFILLNSVDVYDDSGNYVSTIDADDDFKESLPIGYYYMDFVSENGEHSLLPDGRIAFAPMMQGGLPVDGPHFLDDIEASVWGVEVHPDLEANAHLVIRQREMDETLLPWKNYFSSWGNAENPDWDPSIDLPNDGYRSYSTGASGTYASQRLRVTWEASFAMTGKFALSPSDTTTCNTATSCWTHTSSTPSGSYYAYWDADSDNVGYIDYDTSAWSTANSNYGSAGSCAGAWSPCGISVPVSNVRNYTCQSSSGACTSGTGASVTKPHGGQCKMFQNLLLYRSGQYNSGSWRTLPSDDTIIKNPSLYPAESSSTMGVGDVLRNPSQIHSTIIVAIDTSTSSALVVDSNWVGTTSLYYEYIGAHVMGFSGTGVTDLDNYKKLDCVYSGGC